MVGFVAPIAPERLADVRPLLTDPVVSCFAESRIFPQPGEPVGWGKPMVLGYYRGGEVVSAILLGANLVPIATDDQSRRAFSDYLIKMGRRCSSIVGPAHEALALWELLSAHWGPARDIRERQPLLAISRPPDVAPDPAVQPVTSAQLDQFLPASVAMFTEEVGVSPNAGGVGGLYRMRVADLIAAGRAFARWDNGEVVFKAEIGAVTTRAVQVQGVWVPPKRRGTGISVAGMAAIVASGLRLAPTVSLYVNHYNVPALAAYRRVGFTQVGTFATVLFP